MESKTDIIYELLANDNVEGLVSIIRKMMKNDVQSKKDWDDLITILQVGCQETYHKHWLKTHHIVLSIFGMPELRGVDCSLFSELRSLGTPKSFEHAADKFFLILEEIAGTQFKNGGSTLFFDATKISSTRSAILIADLIQARYRETIHVLNEIDEMLPSLTKEWVNIGRLWRTGNGFRMLRARNRGVLIHMKEYGDIRNLLAREMKVDPEKISDESRKLKEEGKADYLQLSKPLNEFVEGLIASRGVRGTFEPHYKTWIDQEGLDEF
jgi:hypothetical protein